jgi:alpha-1,6-mannosyltransferase
MSNKIGIYIAAVVMLLLTLDIGYFIDRHNFIHLITAYSLLFVAYFYVVKKKIGGFETLQKLNNSQTSSQSSLYFSLNSFHFLLFTALILRGVLIFSMPNLSEDIYRFIWDGRLIHLGINPFNHKPSYFIENQLFSETLTPQLFQQLNSKDYFTVYPPVCQAVFAMAVWLFPTSIYGSMVVIKGFLFLCDMGTIYLMLKMLKDSKKALIYALNPLIIIELCGNAHFEAAMIFFFLLAIFILKKGKTETQRSGNFKSYPNVKVSVASAFFLALSVASKMLPLIFLPFFIKRMGLKNAFLYFIGVSFFLVLLFSPLYNAVFINNIKTSLNLYFQKFEFNASVYYVYSTIETARLGFNPILNISKVLMGVVLGSIAILIILDLLLKPKIQNLKSEKTDSFSESFFEKCLFAISIYFLCAAIVHPWYAALPLAISVFTRFRYIMVWTSLLPFTYIHYSYAKPTENFWVIGVEYFIVISFFIFELMKIAPLSIFLKNKNLSETQGSKRS